ncbi:MAG: GNAT family N-acetyltransferase [Candidatus Bathyarchaeota archaeon]|nr:GNAT family N-acetyltransferase [Candidatus Bathyarchaeota archaeon]
MSLDLSFHPLTSERWADLEKLFGKHGASGGCWCMWWRISRADFIKNKGERNRKALKEIVDSGQIPGILAYIDGQPVGWCAVAPRESFPALERSRTLKRVDDKPVWSIVCFFVAKPFRRKGLTVKLLEAAIKYVEEKGGSMVEGYPTDSAKAQPDPFVYTGLASSFRRAGFVEVLRRSKSRLIMRYVIGKKKK